MILDIYKDSLEYSAKDLKTLLVLGVTYFLSFLLLPMFLIYGYSYRVTKISVEGMINGNDPLPAFDNIIDMFVDGIKVVLVYLIYLIVPFIVFILFAAVSSSIGGYGESALMAIGSVVTVVLILFAYVMSMFGVAHMASNGDSLSKAFDYKGYKKLRSLHWFSHYLCSNLCSCFLLDLIRIRILRNIYRNFRICYGSWRNICCRILYSLLRNVVYCRSLHNDNAIKSKRIVIQSSLSN